MNESNNRKDELLLKVELTDLTASGRQLIAQNAQSQFLSDDRQFYKDENWQVKLFDRNLANRGATPMIAVSYHGSTELSANSKTLTQLTFSTGQIRAYLAEDASDGREAVYEMKVGLAKYSKRLNDLGIDDYRFLSPDGQFSSIVYEADAVRRVQRVFTNGRTICRCDGQEQEEPWFEQFAQAEQDLGAYYIVEDATWTVLVEFNQEYSGSPAANLAPRITLHTTAEQLSMVLPKLEHYLEESGAESFLGFTVA